MPMNLCFKQNFNVTLGVWTQKAGRLFKFRWRSLRGRRSRPSAFCAQAACTSSSVSSAAASSASVTEVCEHELLSGFRPCTSRTSAWSLRAHPFAEKELKEDGICSPSSQIVQSITKEFTYFACCCMQVLSRTFSCKYNGIWLTHLPLQRIFAKQSAYSVTHFELATGASNMFRPGRQADPKSVE